MNVHIYLAKNPRHRNTVRVAPCTPNFRTGGRTFLINERVTDILGQLQLKYALLSAYTCAEIRIF